jgi:ATP-binding cassette subfamily A (ABC1) protein 3
MLYMLIGLYFDRVMPNEWGTNLPYTFCFQRSFWCGSSKKADASAQAADQTEGEAEEYNRQHNVQPLTADFKRDHNLSLRISHLVKEFEASDANSSKRRAVNDLCVDMFDGQIFALLGHNGAGKTTLMSILTGMAPATAGRAVINGFDMSNSAEVERVRQNFGFCPQHGMCSATVCLLFAGVCVCALME